MENIEITVGFLVFLTFLGRILEIPCPHIPLHSDKLLRSFCFVGKVCLPTDKIKVNVVIVLCPRPCHSPQPSPLPFRLTNIISHFSFGEWQIQECYRKSTGAGILTYQNTTSIAEQNLFGVDISTFSSNENSYCKVRICYFYWRQWQTACSVTFKAALSI